jgi:hypothetical protein
LLALVATIAVGCDGGNDEQATRVVHPRTPGEAIVEVTASGGIPPAEVRVSDTLPQVWLAGDGRYLAPSGSGARAPALTSLAEWRLGEPAIQRLLQHARRVGLFHPDADFGTPEIFDAVNTRVVVVAGGRRHDVIVRALGYPVTDLDDATLAARAEVSRFLDELEDPASLPDVAAPQPYSPAGVAVLVLGPATSTLTPATWPLGDLATQGTPTGWPTETTRCFVVSGTDVATLSATATQTARSTPWRSGGATWQLALRPLLPDEHTCADIVP